MGRSRYRKLAIVTGAILGAQFLVFSPSIAVAQSASESCELHIWPTDRHAAYFLGARIVPPMSIYRSSRDEVQQQLEEISDEAFQVESIEAVLRTSPDRFSGFRVIFHPIPPEPYFNLDREGAGDRQSTSSSPCYAELHVTSIVYKRTALEKDIQTVFLFRQFGDSQTAVRWYLGADGTGAPAFPAGSAQDTGRARADLRAAFQENLRNFLETRRVRRMERELTAAHTPRP